MSEPDPNTPQTLCEVTVQEWDVPAGSQTAIYNGPDRTLINTIGFTYSSDVLNLGDPFTFTLANPDGRYNQRFQRGARVSFYLSNPDVRGGTRTLKHTGIVVNRTQRGDMQGNFIDVQCADLGWHLRENDAPLYFKLRYSTLEDLLTSPEWIDPSWGILGITADNATSVAIRQALNLGRAQAQLNLQPFGTFVFIQTEPGDRVADVLMTYARRQGFLVTVSPDGYLQIWNPADARPPLYAINLHGWDSGARQSNTVMNYAIMEDIASTWTEVTCIGEIVGGDIQTNTLDQNATKRRNTVYNPQVLPFVHRMGYADGDIYDTETAGRAAAWKYNRGIFESWAATYTVRGHHANGNWWESDTYVTVRDSINGIEGDFYVQSVQYARSERGDITTLTLRRPGLLKASFGPYPYPPPAQKPYWLIEQTKASTHLQRATKTNRK